jgi:hypothetical protein
MIGSSFPSTTAMSCPEASRTYPLNGCTGPKHVHPLVRPSRSKPFLQCWVAMFLDNSPCQVHGQHLRKTLPSRSCFLSVCTQVDMTDVRERVSNKVLVSHHSPSAKAGHLTAVLVQCR